jgi:4-hydroxybenzoate polyprenyltransferase
MFKNLKSYLKLLRVRDWRGYFLITLFGFLISKGFLFPLRDIILFFVIVLLLLAFGFSINVCFDLKEDKYVKEIANPIVNKEIKLKNSLFLSISLGILALGLSITFGMKIFLFCLVGILIGFFYSVPPLRFKSRPILDLISHGLFAGALLFIAPLLIFDQELTLFYFLIAFSIFYLSILAELRNHIEDYKADKIAGLKTTVCILGQEKSQNLLKYLVTFCPLVLLPPFLFISQKYLFLFLIFTFIFLFFSIFKENSKIVKSYLLFNIYILLSFGLILFATR